MPEDGHTWIMDPIDGTMNFSRGIPEVGISVALLRDREPFIGMVHNPFTGRMYCSGVGRGAWRDGTPIRVSDRPLEDCILSTVWCCYEKSLALGIFKAMGSLYPRMNDIRHIGTTAVEPSMRTEGAVDLYFEIKLFPWDYVGALTCMLAASGVCRGIDEKIALDCPSLVLAVNTEDNLDMPLDAVRGGFPNGTPYDVLGNAFGIPSGVNSR